MPLLRCMGLLMLIENELKLDFADVLIRPKRSTLSSRKMADVTRKFKFKYSQCTWAGVPIMASNMDGVGTFDMSSALQSHGLFTCLVKSYSAAEWAENINQLKINTYAISTGITDIDLIKCNHILNEFPQITTICVDVANGYNEKFGYVIEQLRNTYPHHTIIAGNVVTADITQELILRGADIVKVGIGSGAVCLTRLVTGIGYPQLSAIIECADAAHGLGGHIIADGGCTCPGDIAKAFGAGADFVMLGSMLAGHDQGGGEKIYDSKDCLCTATQVLGPNPGAKPTHIKFYGMSSDTAMNKHNGGVAEYRSSEGRTINVPYKGNVNDTVLDILGGLRSSMTYIGAARLKDFSKCTTFIRTNRQFNNSLLK